MKHLSEFRNFSKQLVTLSLGMGLLGLPKIGYAQNLAYNGPNPEIETVTGPTSLYSELLNDSSVVAAKDRTERLRAIRDVFVLNYSVKTGNCSSETQKYNGISSLRKNTYGHNLWLSGSDEYLDGYRMYGEDMHNISFIRQKMAEQASTVKVVPCTAPLLNVKYVDSDVKDIITSTPAVYIVPDNVSPVSVSIPFVPVNTVIAADFGVGAKSYYDQGESKLYLYDETDSIKAEFTLRDKSGKLFDAAAEKISVSQMVSRFVVSSPGIADEFMPDIDNAVKLRSSGKSSFAVSEKKVSEFGASFSGKEVRVFARDMKDIDLYLLAEKEKNIILMPKSYEIAPYYKTSDMAYCEIRTYLGTEIKDSIKSHADLKGEYRGSHEFYIGISSDNGNIYAGDYLRSGKFTFVVCDPRVADILPDGCNMILTGKDSKHAGTVIRTGFSSISRIQDAEGNVNWVGYDKGGNKYPIRIISADGNNFRPSERAVFRGTGSNNYMGPPSEKDIIDILAVQNELINGNAVVSYERRIAPAVASGKNAAGPRTPGLK